MTTTSSVMSIGVCTFWSSLYYERRYRSALYPKVLPPNHSRRNEGLTMRRVTMSQNTKRSREGPSEQPSRPFRGYEITSQPQLSIANARREVIMYQQLRPAM